MACRVLKISATLVLAMSISLGNAFAEEIKTRDLSTGPASVADLAERLQDAVVNIAISQKADDGENDTPAPLADENAPFQEYFRDFFKDRGGRDRSNRNIASLGSGFVIDEEGYIVTNNHVVEGAGRITINFANGRQLDGTLVGTDKKTDLALVKVEPEWPLKVVKFGDSDEMRIGDWVMAIGNPFGLGGTVTLGIVSARGRNINAGPFDDFLQTDAAINKGNSGGPLFNMYGDVIGVNTAIISPSGGSIGIGFATPAEIATHVIAQLKEFGETQRGWLGVRIQEVGNDIAPGLGLDEPRGALIAGIIDDGPAVGGPLKAGDVVLRFNGKDIRRSRDLARIVAESAINEDLPATILRDGKEIDVTLRLAQVEEPEDEVAAADEEAPPAADDEEQAVVGDLYVLGMLVAELDDSVREEFGIKETVEGVAVRDVELNSAAALEGIVVGDVIVEISQEAVSTPQDVADKIAALRDEGRRNAQVLISNPDGDLRFLSLLLE